MGRLSNSIPGRDVGIDLARDSVGIECRPVAQGEIEPGLRLILASEGRLGTDVQILDFCTYCVDRKIDTNLMWVAVHQDRIAWAMLPVPSPGRTMMLFAPTMLFTQTPPAAIAMLTYSVSKHYAQRGVQMAQMLVDPDCRPAINVLVHSGFDELAELVYLQKEVRRHSHDLPALPPGMSLQTYSPQSHAAFASIIQRSYEQSMDCPELNGMRDMNDVIASHRATGDFDAGMWWILCENQTPIATLLLSRLTQGSSIELVYLGLARNARARGISDLLMRHALATTARDGKETLSLAVDSRNQPALRLYYRHGMKRIGSRVALLRILKPELIAMRSRAKPSPRL